VNGRDVLATWAYAGLLGFGGCQYVAPSHHPIADYTELIAAVDACDIATVRRALEQDPGAIRTTEWEHAGLLHEAVGRQCDQLAAYLITAGANPNAKKSDGVTPLHLAAQHGMVPTMELLLEHGANINAADAEGRTALDRAELWGKPEAAEYLKRHGGVRRRSPPPAG
jgi:hypothetical protein